MITCGISFLSLLFILYDTIGYITVHSNKEATEDSKSDYVRLVRTWIFYIGVGWLSCMFCPFTQGEGYIAGLLALIFSFSKLLIALPVSGISLKLQKIIIDDSLVCKLVGKFTSCIGSKMGCCMNTSCNEEKKCDSAEETGTIQ